MFKLKSPTLIDKSQEIISYNLQCKNFYLKLIWTGNNVAVCFVLYQSYGRRPTDQYIVMSPIIYKNWLANRHNFARVFLTMMLFVLYLFTMCLTWEIHPNFTRLSLVVNSNRKLFQSCTIKRFTLKCSMFVNTLHVWCALNFVDLCVSLFPLGLRFPLDKIPKPRKSTITNSLQAVGRPTCTSTNKGSCLVFWSMRVRKHTSHTWNG